MADTPPPRPGSDHAESAEGTLDRGLALVRFLRAHCPWDAEQTHESLVPYLLEESHEVVDAIHRGDDRGLEGELGDLLLNLAFQVVVGEERGALTAESVTRRIEEKMRRRHPHLYGDGPEVPWMEIKARERAREARARAESGLEEEVEGVLDAIPASLDPLTMAYLVQDRVGGVGFDWPDWHGPEEKVREELDEVRDELVSGEVEPEALEDELGDLLFAVVNLVRKAGAHPVKALDRANRKFAARFRAVERLAEESGVEFGVASLEELDELWDAVKRQEAAGGSGEPR